MNANNKNKLMVYFLAVIQTFIGITAIAGGLRLVSNPSGLPDFPIEWLINSPFTNYFFPGLVLMIVIGFGYVVSGTVTFLRKGYSGSMAALLGICLILYMTIEVWFVGLRNFLQPLYFILGVIVLLLGLKIFKSANNLLRIEVESTPR
ncbi:MAG TPA: hypothetical protein DCY53_01075 [Desulfobacteraceae bacterium]|nr:hypothetical protein [Desulfobacteraceae bacterium]